MAPGVDLGPDRQQRDGDGRVRRLIARAADRLRCRARGSLQRLVLAVDHENHGMRSTEPPWIIMSYQALTIAMRVSLVRPPVPRYNSLKIGAK